jgi:hypothetical protein
MDNPAGSYSVDMADLLDKPDEIIADELNVTLVQANRILAMIDREKTEFAALTLGRMIGWVLMGGNVQVKIYALAFAAGLDQLNGLHSQSEAAKKLGITRSLLSHYVISARDALGISVTKYRKSESSRATYRDTQLKRHGKTPPHHAGEDH